MSGRPGLALFAIACLLAAAAPFLARDGAPAATAIPFPGWPDRFEGKEIRQTGLSPEEQAFNGKFPGKMARFTDGSRWIVIRWVTEPTHRVHSGADCLQSAGYAMEPQDLWRDGEGQVWSVWKATGRSGTRRVRERCYDTRGASWSDVLSWFWAAILGRTAGPWWVVTVEE